ncbi:MAG: hypothetical protein PHY21_00155 [Candidatus Cloacimonetes bacterium]|nr:hypothetical protein [Candidatus Cloacimonadota bacterium]
MKRLSLVLIMLSVVFLSGEDWQTINNTNHVYNITKADSNLYLATWGGVLHIEGNSPSQMNEIKHWTSGDGLVSNDIRCIEQGEDSNSLWLGSRDDGITVITSSGVQNLDLDFGLPSLSINSFLEYGSRMLVATDQGMVVYYYLPGVSFPLLLNQYNRTTTGNALLSDNINELHLANNGILFLATAAGINYVAIDSLDINDAWHSLNSSGTLPSSPSYLISSNNNRIAVATQTQVYVNDLSLNPDSWESIALHPDPEPRVISAIMLSSSDDLWVAYGEWDDRILYYDRSDSLLMSKISPEGNITSYYESTNNLGLKSIASIQEFDSDIFISTWGEGIAKFDTLRNEWDFFYSNSIGFPRITQSNAGKDNSLWFASGNIGDHLVPKGTMGVSKYKDGIWTNLTINNSPLQSDNIMTIGIDKYDRRWFGAWSTAYEIGPWFPGITILDERNGSWKRLTKWGVADYDPELGEYGSYISGSPRLLGNTIHDVYRDLYDNMFVMCYDDGITVLDSDLNHLRDFELKNSPYQRVLNVHHNGRQYFFGTENDSGLSIWNHDSIPETDGTHWVTNIPSELKQGTIYGVASTETPYSGWYHFIASGSGLYMWDETNWYRYDTYIKRYIYNFSTFQWNNDTLYYADEERLFGSISTVPNSIFGDPFGRIWIGSYDNGISMYNPVTERFTNYFQANSPLLSNRIISFGYDPLEGRLLIGTPDGLNTFKIGRTVKPDVSLSTVKAFPNPFRPDGFSTVQIVNLPADSMPKGSNKCSIYSSSGALIQQLKENPFARFEWNGKNKAGDLVSSGIYFFVIVDDDGNIANGKIAIIRE